MRGEFHLTSNVRVRRKVGSAIIRIKVGSGWEEELSGATIVAFGIRNDETILGGHALDALGLEGDLKKKRVEESCTFFMILF